ncbi:MAG TPA: NAD(P)H-binding protein [Actinocrinis sp.]|nr:NAD(P)H-binding protein [Actinocrinis sp.]
MKIAVAGGTGWVGRLVVEALWDAGETPVVLARSTGVDLTTGAGLDEALAGACAVVDTTNVTSVGRRRSVAFFETATANLLAAGRRAGVGHHVALSIVGCDRVDLGYYLGKRRQEELVLADGVPGTVLRTTQFHEFAARMLGRGGRFALAPRQLSQPVAAREVAVALAELARTEPVGLAPELAGPEQHWMPDLVRRLARARGTRRVVVPVRVPGRAGKAMAHGGLLPAEPGPRGRITFDAWLADGAADPLSGWTSEGGAHRTAPPA